MSNAFPRHIEEILDSYRIPEMSDGFADRVVAAAVAGQGNKTRSGTILPRRRNRLSAKNSPWSRGRYIVSSVAGMALLSTAAAAALSLAEIELRIPIVSDLVERVLPMKQSPVALAKTAIEPKLATEQVAADDVDVIADGKGLVRPRWKDLERPEKVAILKKVTRNNEARIQERRAAKGLPPLTKNQLKLRRTAIRRAVRNGDIPRPVVRRAMRRAVIESRDTMPATKRLVNAEGSGTPAIVTKPAPVIPLHLDENSVESAASTDQSEENLTGNPSAVVSSGEVVAEQTDNGTSSSDLAPSDTSSPLNNADIRSTLRDRLPSALKVKLRKASPSERRRILRDLRQRRQNGKTLRDARKQIRSIRRNTK